MSLALVISVNDGAWRRGNYAPSTKVADLDPSIVLVWRNMNRIYNTSDTTRNDNNQMTLEQLGVRDKNVLTMYTETYAAFLIPERNFAEIIPSHVRKIQRFCESASVVFELSKIRRTGPLSTQNVSSSQLEWIRNLVSSMASNNERSERNIGRAYEAMNHNPHIYALDLPEFVEEFVKAKPTLEQFRPMFNKAMDELDRRQKVMRENPNSEEGRRFIQQREKNQNIKQMFETSHEHHPEHHVQVTMLYINLTINGVPVKAFIDSGAQVSIMSAACAKRCNLEDLIDRRFRSVLHGVGGTNKCDGMIHLCDVKVENAHFMCPFRIMPDRELDLLIGLDVLRAHNCCINLARNVLQFPNGIETVFLQSNVIDKHLHEVVGTGIIDEEMEIDQPSSSGAKK